jgi:hypothetical protein
MTDLVTALQGKISALEDEKEEHEDAIERIDIKLETYAELLAEETGDAAPAPAKKRGRGRPKGAKNKKAATKAAKKESTAPKDELWEQAESTLPEGSSGTTAEEQAKAIRRFNPTPRPEPNYGVRAGTPEEVMGAGEEAAKKTHTNVTVEDQ